MLSQLRGVADEIVVAVDSRIDPDRLGHYATVADRLHRFEFAAPIERAWPWLYSQASCDWILRLDGDEVASPGLIEELPELIEEKDVIQYWLPRRWLFPDRTSWIFEWPWWPDYTNRLTRNDPLLWIPGLSHTAAEPELPARYLEAPLYHLDTVLNTLADRQAKIARYRAIDDALREPASDRYLATFFLPERYVRRQPLVVPDVDRVALDAVLDARPNGSHPAALDLPVVARDEIDRCWPERELDSAAYRATIRPLDRYRSFAPGEHRQFHVLVRNEGDEIWPGGDRHPLILAAYRWLRQDGSVLVAEGFRSALSCPLAPSDELVVAMTVAAPDQAGTFLLEIDLVHE